MREENPAMLLTKNPAQILYKVRPSFWALVGLVSIHGVFVSAQFLDRLSLSPCPESVHLFKYHGFVFHRPVYQRR